MIVHTDTSERLEAHMGLVYLVVGKLLDSGYIRMADRDEAIQEGRIGLDSAFRRYKPDRGADWAMYATYFVRHAIVKHFGRERSVAKGLLRAAQALPDSLRALADQKGADKMADALDERLEALREAMKTLDPREYEIVSRRFGIDGFRPTLMRDFSLSLKLRPVEIRALEKQALAKLKAALKAEPVDSPLS